MKYLKMGDRLKSLRTEKHLTLKQISERIDISISMLSAYETENRHPSYATLLKLSRLYGVTCDYIISGDMDPQRYIDVTGLSSREINSIHEIVEIMKDSHKEENQT